MGSMDPGLLFIPGPVPLPPEVREEMAKAALPHYGDAWVKAHSETHDMLRYLWSAPDAHVFPIAGPGHAALEAIAYTFLRPGDRVVVVSNGFFGERTHEVLQSHRVKAEVVASPWGAAPDLAKLRAALKTPTKAVVFVHNETSTGVTNALEPIVEAAHAADAFVVVDAVSSLGGLPLPFGKLGIDAGFTASQKCIAAPAGIAPVAVAPALWESVDPTSVEGWYLNLFTWDRYEREWGDWHPTPTTISSNLFYAFHRALTLLRKEGLEARVARHAKVAAKLRAGLIDLGFKPVGPAAHLSNTVACLTPPEGVDPMRLVRRLKEEHNIYISGGLGPLRGKTIRIGTMGTQADLETIDWLLKAMRASL
ncbi:MAG: alanine--glyoxylate aminotransferase family protein [Methanobacteriota archaeon]|nr:MAG: alanine--glyoxylate aminotransferase family protein [Euryarchaeota archaeon]TMA05080.1 MAG: alanine--glyoxylate aminotransferase family protein [Euryarchaeota archaeon]